MGSYGTSFFFPLFMSSPLNPFAFVDAKSSFLSFLIVYDFGSCRYGIAKGSPSRLYSNLGVDFVLDLDRSIFPAKIGFPHPTPSTFSPTFLTCAWWLWWCERPPLPIPVPLIASFFFLLQFLFSSPLLHFSTSLFTLFFSLFLSFFSPFFHLFFSLFSSSLIFTLHFSTYLSFFSHLSPLLPSRLPSLVSASHLSPSFSLTLSPATPHTSHLTHNLPPSSSSLRSSLFSLPSTFHFPPSTLLHLFR
uniref:Uncharacterized protein n=1 Tax=Palpitomonas bilix TaxID=652834 RepID=A0A7S3DGP9_9EUKA